MKEKPNYSIRFWVYATGFCFLWGLLPTLFHSAYRMDVVELQIVSKEWVLSTAKHPMLPAWILEVVNLMTGDSFAAPFIAAQLCVLLTLWSVWSFAKTVLSPKLAFYAFVSILPYWYFTVRSSNYNQNIVLLPLWALTIWWSFEALRTNHWRYWCGVGFVVGAAFYAKYTIVFLIFPILLYSVWAPQVRQRWGSLKPYTAIAVALLVMLPDLIWLYRHDFVCFSYVKKQVVEQANLNFLTQFEVIIVFVLAQAYYILPMIIVLWPLLGRPWKRKKKPDEREIQAGTYLSVVIGLPFLLHLLIGMIPGTRLYEAWGSVLWPFLGVWLLLRFQVDESKARESRSIQFLFLIKTCLILIFVYQSLLTSLFLNKPHPTSFPMRELGVAADQIWGEYSKGPCPFTTGDWYIAGKAAIMMKDRPRVLFYWTGMEKRNAPLTGLWASDADVNEKGGLVFWELLQKDFSEVPEISDEDVPDYVLRRFPNAMVQPKPIVLPYKINAKIPPVQIGVAVVPPP